MVSNAQMGPCLRHLLDSIHALKRKRKLQLTAIAALWSLLPAVVILFAAAGLDVLCHFSHPTRYIACGVFVIAIIAAIAFVIRAALAKLSDEAMATLLEKAHPEADNAFINAVQFAASEETSPEIVETLLADTDVNPATIKALELYSKRPLKWLAAALPAVLAVVLIPMAVAPERMSVALRRILRPGSDLLPYAKTRIISISPQNARVQRGEELTITVVLEGDIPSENVIHWCAAPDAAVEKLSMKQDSETEPRFSVKSPPVFDQAKFRLKAGDSTSAWQYVTLDNPPALLLWEATATPPPYTEMQPAQINSTQEKQSVIGGSRMKLHAQISKPLSKAELIQNETVLTSCDSKDNPSEAIDVDFVTLLDGQILLKLTETDGSATSIPFPINIIADRSPSIQLVDTPTSITVRPDEPFAVAFQATDDFGIARAGIERLLEDNGAEEVRAVSPEERTKVFAARFTVETATFNQKEELRFRLWAEDETSSASRRRAKSAIIHVKIQQAENAVVDKAEALRETAIGIADILKMQKTALKDTNLLLEQTITNKKLPEDRLADIHARQRTIRDESIKLLDNRAALGGFADVIVGLVNQEMLQAIAAFDDIHQAPRNQKADAIRKCTALQTAIVAALSNLNLDALAREQEHQAKTDIFAAVQALLKKQQTAYKDAIDAKEGEKIVLSALARNQDNVAHGILNIQQLCAAYITEHADDDFANQLKAANKAIEDGKAYDHALGAAEAIEDNDLDAAIDDQKATLKVLADVLSIINKWRLSNFKKTIDDVKKALVEAKDVLDEMEKKQAAITSTVREIKANANMDDEAKEELAKAAKEHEEMLDMIEKAANDLYQFPELPLCNELNSKMREIYEDVTQARDSEKAEAVEIAVQKEDAILDAIRNTKERIDDVEMWLPDTPDHFVWNMESFDTDEFPEIPLVELPEELEDIVGELLDQDTPIDDQSQDGTSNNIIADAEMGWAIMDGNMPSFAAKGKTGNTRPNDNEMTGRSGSGREGQANGELVENHVKGYEGRQTHARRTQDQFQKGMVTEDKDSTMKARATGGGKLGGESEAIGMFGNAPRRDLHTAAHGKNPREIRKETEAMYASARMLYVNPGNLGEAARELRAVENQPPDLKDLNSVRKRVLRNLSDTQVSAQSGAVLPLPVFSGNRQGGSAAADISLDNVSDEYKGLINNYYRSLDK